MLYYSLFWALVVVIGLALDSRAAEASHDNSASSVLEVLKGFDPGSIAVICVVFLLWQIVSKIGAPWARIAMVRYGITSRGEERGGGDDGKPKPNPMQAAILEKMEQVKTDLKSDHAALGQKIDTGLKDMRDYVDLHDGELRRYVDENTKTLHSRVTDVSGRLSRVEGRLDGARGAGDD